MNKLVNLIQISLLKVKIIWNYKITIDIILNFYLIINILCIYII